MTRTCNRCQIEKPIEDFSRDKNRRDGRAYTCRACNSEKACAWSKANRDRVQANQKRWRDANRSKQRTSSRAYYARNRERLRAQTNARRAADPNRRSVERWKWIQREYGMSREQWLALFDSQGARCGCCGTAEPGSACGWHTDHDHRTGAVRGIVCAGCNIMLGAARDSPRTLAAGIAYLERQC